MGMQMSDRREHVLKILFMDGFHRPEDMEGVISTYFDCLDYYEPEEEEDRGGLPSLKDRDLIREKFESIRSCYDQIDESLNRISEGWRTGRMSQVDLAILRLAVYEILYDDTVPVGVSINEAVEFGKVYGGSGSYAFINGILGELARNKE